MRPRPPFVVALFLAFALIAPMLLTSPAYSQSPAESFPLTSVRSDRVPNRSVEPRWIVRLLDAPLAQASTAQSPQYATATLAKPGNRLQVDSPAAVQYRAYLRQQQDSVLNTIQNAFPTAQIHRRYDVVFNGMSIVLPNADEAAVDRLRAMPGVAEVYPDYVYEMHMASSIPIIGADALWNSAAIGSQGSAGGGVKIAIIDSGIKVDNPFFNPEGFSYPAGFPKGDPAHTTPKVIAARAYFRPDLPPIDGSETPQPGPEDSSHGTHVAGTAAGVANTSATINGLTQVISGVAPRAYLMNYKTFYSNDSAFSGSAFATELIAALNDAVIDGADVINNSWGGRPDVDPLFDPIVVAAEAAVDAGVTVVFSAGNEGPNPSTAGSPAYSDKLISVGASTTAQAIIAGFVDATAPEGAPESLLEQPYQSAAFGPPIEGGIWGPSPYTPVSMVSDSTLACEPLPTGSLSGQIALIERGVCPFSLKVLNAQIGGATSAIVYNSEAGGEDLVIMAPSDGAEAIGIPSVFVRRSTGQALVDWYNQHGAAAQLRIDPLARATERTPDVLASFSSRGPTFQGSLKPDVVAPGVGILSSGFANAEGAEQHTGFGVLSGTSMASPHVTGSAALLLQIHPDWSPADVKSALMSTAVIDVWLDEDRTQRAGLLGQGAGRIDVNRAADTALIFDRPMLSYGNLSTALDQPTRAELAVTARNVSGAAQTFTLTANRTAGPDFGITVAPISVTLAAGETVAFNVVIDIPANAPSGDYEGMVTLEGAQSLHLPLWARALPAERAAKVLLIDNDGSASLGLPDYSGYYGNALIELAVPFQYLDVDALASQPQTLPDISEIQKHEIIIWFTGDNAAPDGSFIVPTPLTAIDQDILIAYLQSGGSLIATGQDLTWAADISPDPDPFYGRSDIYHSYLGARFVQDDVFNTMLLDEQRLAGTGAQPWLENIVLDVGVPQGGEFSDKTGAGNQYSIDETAVYDSDPRTLPLDVTPIFRAVSTGGSTGNIVGLNRSSEPSLEQPALAVRYRATYLAFGLEGVRSDVNATTRMELLQALLYWHVDRPTVSIEGTGVVTDANQLATFTAVPESNTPTAFVRYRWDLGDGSPIVETEGATVVHQYAQPGVYQPRVEVTDSWGHRAIGGLAAVEASAPGDASPSAAGSVFTAAALEYAAVVPSAPAASRGVIRQLGFPYMRFE